MTEKNEILVIKYCRVAIFSIIALATLPFVYHAGGFGWRGLTETLRAATHLSNAETPAANFAIFSHMICGAVITIMVFVQLVPGLRERYRNVHRWNGRLIVLASIVASLGGLYYILARGTIGGRAMDIAFAGYGTAMLVCALQVIRHARARHFARHQEWALRLFVLCIGSWLYRVHYGLWDVTTGRLWREPDYSGAFDLANLYLFYVPYLVAVEVYLRLAKARPVTPVPS